MVVTIDANSGFCAGVTSAIRKAEEELQNGSLYCLGDIVHNGQEVQRLANLGLETIDYDDLRTLHGGRVLLRAHGEPPSTYHIAEQNDIHIIDASCPVVLHLQKRIRETYRHIRETGNNGQIVIYGQRGHAEVIGLCGQTQDTAIVVEKADDLAEVDFSRPVYLFSQTTKSVAGFMQLVETVRERMQAGVVFQYKDTICRSVANRVAELRRFAAERDIVLFVGGRKSSNAKVLFQHCLEANPRSLFIEQPNDLNEQMLRECHAAERIGICGATSTPHWLMEEVKERLLSTL